MLSQIKDRKHIEQNFHSVAKFMPRNGTAGAGGVKNFSVRICNGAQSTARSSMKLFFICVVGIDHGIISRVILLPSPESFKKGCCQLQAKVCARITG